MPVKLASVSGQSSQERPEVIASVKKKLPFSSKNVSPVSGTYVGDTYKIKPEHIAGIQGARSAGYNDDEILKTFSSKNPTAVDIKGAKSAGYSSSDILDNIISVYPSSRPFGQKTAQSIMGAVEKAENLPGIKQAREFIGRGVGGGVALAGGLIGGTVAAIGTPIANAMNDRPLFENFGKNVASNASSTAQFGERIGTAGGEAAPLAIATGGLGRVPNALLAYGAGYQGLENTVEGIRSGNVEQTVAGAGQTALAGFGLKQSVMPRGLKATVTDPLNRAGTPTPGMVMNKKLVPVKQTVQNMTGMTANADKQVLNAYEDMLNIPKSQVRKLADLNKNPAATMQQYGIKPPETYTGKLDTDVADDMMRQVDEYLDPMTQWTKPYIASSGGYVNMTEIFRKAASHFSRSEGTVYQQKLGRLKAEFDAIEQNFGSLLSRNNNGDLIAPLGIADDIAGAQQRQAYGRTFSDVDKLSHDVHYQIGNRTRQAVYDALPENSPVKELNAEVSRLLNVKETIHSRIGTTSRNAGQLSKMFARGVGASVGSSIGGPGGALAGFITGGKLQEVLSNPRNRMEFWRALSTEIRSPNGQQMADDVARQLFELYMTRTTTPRLNPGAGANYRSPNPRNTSPSRGGGER